MSEKIPNSSGNSTNNGWGSLTEWDYFQGAGFMTPEQAEAAKRKAEAANAKYNKQPEQPTLENEARAKLEAERAKSDGNNIENILESDNLDSSLTADADPGRNNRNPAPAPDGSNIMDILESDNLGSSLTADADPGRGNRNPAPAPDGSDIMDILESDVLDSSLTADADPGRNNRNPAPAPDGSNIMDILESDVLDSSLTADADPGRNNRKTEDEEHDKLEEEERKKLEEEERKKHELEELAKEEEELKKQADKLAKELGPLAAINADFTHDKAELARDIAERQINEETAKGNLLKRIWKGNLAKKYYLRKRERELMNGNRLVNVEGTNMNLNEILESRKDSVIQRFVLGGTEDMRYIHSAISSKNRNGQDPGGETLTEADGETTAAVKSAIEKFASAKIPEGGNLEDLKRQFREDVKRLEAEGRDDGEPLNSVLLNNYLEVAIQARERVEHGLAIEKVMEGFKVYNAEARSGVRTETHRDNIDKIVDRYERSRFGQLIPPEIIAGALGTAFALTQTGARALGGVGAGIGVSAIASGLRERNRVTEDRSRMLRDVANSINYDGTNSPNRNAKYEQRIGGTLYDMRSAESLTNSINSAVESGDSDAILKAIAEARVRIDFSDSEQKDLIAYSSTGKRGDERLALDIATIRAERNLSDEDRAKVETLKNTLQNQITESVNKQDQNFTRIRAAQALKQAGKTAFVGSAFFFASQEIMAAISPSKIGLFEKAGILKTNNNADANETIIASAIGERGAANEVTVSGDDVATRQRLIDAGYTETETMPGNTAMKPTFTEVAPAESNHRANIIIDAWANNGTQVSDGNELRGYLDGTMVSGMYGDSTLPDGTVINYEDMVAAGRVKAYITVGGARFELAPNAGTGALSWGEDGVFTTTAGDTIKGIGDNGEKLYQYFEIAVDNGTDADGFTHITPLATDVGTGAFDGKIQQLVNIPTDTPAEYTYTKETPIFYGGVVAAPTARTGLGTPRPPQNPPVVASRPAPAPAPNPEPSQPQPDNPQPEQPQQPQQPQPENPEPGQPDAPEQSGQPSDNSESDDQPASENPESNQPTSTDNISEALRQAVGDFGVNLMTRPNGEGLSDEETTQLASWWSGLSDDTRGDLARWAVQSSIDNSSSGAALRGFIQMQSQNQA